MLCIVYLREHGSEKIIANIIRKSSEIVTKTFRARVSGPRQGDGFYPPVDFKATAMLKEIRMFHVPAAT